MTIEDAAWEEIVASREEQEQEVLSEQEREEESLRELQAKAEANLDNDYDELNNIK